MVCAAQIQGEYVAGSLKLPQDLIHIWQRIRISLRGGIHLSHVDHHAMFITFGTMKTGLVHGLDEGSINPAASISRTC